MGVWWSGSRRSPDGGPDVAAELESLGYRTFWMSGGFGPGLADRFGKVLKATREMVVASGIVSIWPNDPATLAGEVAALQRDHPGRFLLGLGVSHAPVVEASGTSYRHPYSRMVDFLDDLDRATPTVPPADRVLAALGPRMLRLAADRSAGAHPYFVPVRHVAEARAVLGPGRLLAVELAVVLETDPDRARTLARDYTTGYLSLPNYAGNLLRLGSTEEDLAGGGSDRLVDSLIAWGDEEAVLDRVRAFREAGADHVCLQVLGEAGLGTFPLGDYRRIAAALTG